MNCFIIAMIGKVQESLMNKHYWSSKIRANSHKSIGKVNNTLRSGTSEQHILYKSHHFSQAHAKLTRYLHYSAESLLTLQKAFFHYLHTLEASQGIIYSIRVEHNLCKFCARCKVIYSFVHLVRYMAELFNNLYAENYQYFCIVNILKT